MFSKDKLLDSAIIFLAFIPHAILLASVLSGSDNVLGIASLKDVLESLYYCATIIAVFYAIKAYDTWKHSLQAEWDREVIQKLHSEIEKYLYKIESIPVYDLQFKIRIANHHTLLLIQKPDKEYNNDIINFFCNNPLKYRAKEIASPSSEYLNRLVIFENNAQKYARETIDIYNTIYRKYEDMGIEPPYTPGTLNDLKTIASEERFKKIKNLKKSTLESYDNLVSYKPIK